MCWWNGMENFHGFQGHSGATINPFVSSSGFYVQQNFLVRRPRILMLRIQTHYPGPGGTSRHNSWLTSPKHELQSRS